LESSLEKYIKFAAFSCGEFPYVKPWINGLITNFRFTRKRLERQKNKTKDYFFLTKLDRPRLVFISSVSKSFPAIREVNQSNIPSIAIIDTSAISYAVNLAIPGNDESVDCVILYNNIICNFISRQKFNLIIL